MNRILISALLASLLGACTTPPPPAATPAAPAAQATPTPATPAPVASSQGQQRVLPPYEDPKNLLSQKRNVYFDVDEYTIKDQYRSIVEAHAKYLGSNPDQKIKIEGNADENGSREYNLALGQKRAQAVKKVMTILGVKENQIEAISWGEERPKAAGHDESAWKENRRADIKYGNEK
ncbi:MAG TPA: peptidoglycan-associated lipoprotein Pal [Burkholderiaceae bacterium]|jgi:peptidoglycan-associated lipoprotein|nr:peptidoglycan-associated lipoprotein Pal [Burkholderiaceae bacterium]